MINSIENTHFEEKFALKPEIAIFTEILRAKYEMYGVYKAPRREPPVIIRLTDMLKNGGFQQKITDMCTH